MIVIKRTAIVVIVRIVIIVVVQIIAVSLDKSVFGTQTCCGRYGIAESNLRSESLLTNCAHPFVQPEGSKGRTGMIRGVIPLGVSGLRGLGFRIWFRI